MRAGRILRRTFMTAVLVLPAGLIGTAVALGWSPPGRRFSSRLASSLITSSVNGRIAIGSIEGNLINTAVLRGVELRDSIGRPVVSANRIEVHYALLDLYAGRLVFRDVALDTAVVHLVRTRADRWNYQDIFRSGLDTAAAPTASPLVELHDVRVRDLSLRVDVPTEPIPPAVPISRNATPLPAPRVEIGPDGPVRVYTAEHLQGRFRQIRVSTPADDPIFVDVLSLSTVLSDPAVTVVGLEGTFTTAADSLRFDLRRAAMPGTVVHGAGVVRWPRGPMLFDFELDSDTVDLKDLRWISPDFPDWQGRGHVVAHALSDRRTAYRLTQLRLGNARSMATGGMTALIDASRGLGFEGLALSLTGVPLAVARPYLDTLPFAGTLDGLLRADGFLDTMRIGGDLFFADALVEGMPRSHLVMNGAIHFGGDAGAVFEGFQLNGSTVPLATIRRIVPSVEIPGMLTLTGQVDGPWTQVTFRGTTEHLSPGQARSRMVGRVMLDTRDTLLAIDLDAEFDPLSFDGLRSGYPSIKARGSLGGHLALKGRLDSLTVDGAMTGDIGTMRMGGTFGMVGSTLEADSLRLDFASLDTDALLGKFGTTSFTGHALLRGTLDSAANPRGVVTFGLDRSWVGEFLVEAAEGRIRADSGLALIDTLRVDLPEGWVDVEGNLGLDTTHAGTLLIDAGFLSLSPFDSLLRAMTGMAPDTIGPRPLGGTVHGNFTVTGSVADPMLTGIVQAKDLVLDRWRVARVFADIKADSLGWRTLDVVADADSLGHAAQVMEKTSLRLDGRLDSLRIAVDGKMYRSSFAALAHWAQRDSTGGSGSIDSLSLAMPRQTWRLARQIPIAFGDRRALFGDTLLLQTRDGSGQVAIGGAVPGAEPGDLSVSVIGLDVHDLTSMIQRDSSLLNGFLSMDLRLRGTAAAPLIRGSAAFTAPSFGDLRVPLTRVALDYQDQRLRSQVTFWKTGEPLLQADVSLPIDLAFSPAGPRKLPGAIEIVAHADSADLGLLEAFSTDVRGARGFLDLDMKATGTWADPRLEGMARIKDGIVTLPSLNVEYSGINALLRFSGDSVVADTFRIRSGGGALYGSGSMRFAQLASPTLNLGFRTSNFLLMDVPSYMTLRPSGEVTLRGPMMRPTLTGQVSLANSVIYYTDLVSKSLVEFSDPIFADLVDTVAIRKQGLERSLQNRFMDSLRIDGMIFRLEEDVWLRSSEANINLTSDDVRISKSPFGYQVDGSFNAERGTYDLTLAYALKRTFNIDRGTVAFFGTGDLNASLNLQASHTVRTREGDEIPLVATITGEIREPHIDLTSPGRNLTQQDQIAYLYFGQPASQLGLNQSSGATFGLGFGASFLSTTLSQALSRNNLGVGVNFSVIGDKGVTAGISRQLGDQAFISLSGGVCSALKVFSTTLEYRLNNSFRLQTSFQPVRTCLLDPTATSVPYQFGADLLWRRVY